MRLSVPMRPDILTPLFASARSLKGVGPKLELFLEKALRLPPGVTEPRLIDLLWHSPTAIVDRSDQPSIAAAVPGTIATLKVRVLKHRIPSRGSKAPFTVSCEDDTGRIDLIYFHVDPIFVARDLPVGEERLISGRIEAYGDKMQMPHPDYVVKHENAAALPLMEPVYPLTAGLSGKVLAKLVREAVTRCRTFPIGSTRISVRCGSSPNSRSHCAACTGRKSQPPSRRRAPTGSGSPMTKCWPASWPSRWCASRRVDPRPRGEGQRRHPRRIIAALPSSLTGSQARRSTRSRPTSPPLSRMLRLLQGDVGSGKTVVALMTLASASRSAPRAR